LEKNIMALKKITQKSAITAYKVFDPDWKCRDFQFEVGKTYKHTGRVRICNSGFHACLQVSDCFSYYDFKSQNKVAEVLIWGDTESHDEDTKICGSNIKIVRELEWAEVLKLANIGQDNTGHSNSGNWNSGYRNSGNWNSGYRNSGDQNSGDRNSGNWNSGDRNSGNWNSGNQNSGNWNSGYRNSGYRNSGNWNSGNRNSGDQNSGDQNSGYRNSGNWNSGDRNSGDQNSGYRNSGYRNSGNWNSGNRNSGDQNSGDQNSGYRNSGNWNSGDRNSGDQNSGYRNSGAFCTNDNPEVWLFDKPSGILVKDWENHQAVQILLRNLEINIWIYSNSMSDAEKEAHPGWQVRDGYLKTISLKEAWANMWPNLDQRSRQVFLDLPNFSWEKFTHITGIEEGK
jgi:hypothetical protein